MELRKTLYMTLGHFLCYDSKMDGVIEFVQLLYDSVGLVVRRF